MALGFRLVGRCEVDHGGGRSAAVSADHTGAMAAPPTAR
jgi:hypothetical protein